VAFVKLLAWLTLRRVKTHWRFMLAAALGVLVAVALAASAMLHSQALAEAGLRHALLYNSVQDYLNLQVYILERPLAQKDYARLDWIVSKAVADHLSWLTTGTHRYGQTNEIPYVRDPSEAPPRTNIPLAMPFYMEGFEEHARLVSGHWPGPPVLQEADLLVVEAVVSRESEQYINLKQGDVVYLAPLPEAPQEKVAVTIVGVMEFVNSKDPFWFRDLSAFRVNFTAEDENGNFVVPMYVGEEAFFQGLGAHYPLTLGDYRWYVALDYMSLTAATATAAKESLAAADSDINKQLARALAFTGVPDLVDQYYRALALARVPLFMFVSLVVGVVLYYLVATTALQARERGQEAAVLRSRGASVVQAGALIGFGEGLVTVLPGIALGPFLGLAATRLLPLGSEILDYPAPVLSWGVLLASLAAGAACVLVFTLAGIGVAGQSIVGFLRERSRTGQRSPLYQYSVDMLVLVALGVLWWQVRSRGGLLSRPIQGGGISVDLALLLGPAVALIATGLAMLRLTPLLLRLLASASNRLGTTWLVHSFRRMAREPLAYTALAVLLMLATALGVFAAAFGATLAQGQADITRYRIGGDIVAPGTTNIADVPGMDTLVPVYRGKVGPRADPQGAGAYTLMAVAPADLKKVAWFRDDFADKSLDDALLPLRQPTPINSGVALPVQATTLGIWVKGQRAYSGYDLRLRLRDTLGRHATLTLGDLNHDGWAYLQSPLPPPSVFQPPYYLTGIFIRGSSITTFGSGWLALDDLSVSVGGQQEVIETFDTLGPWVAMPSLGVTPDVLAVNYAAAHTGDNGLMLTWIQPITATVRGIMTPEVPYPIPAVGGPPFITGQHITGSLEGRPVEFVISETMRYFPSLYSQDSPYLVVSIEHMVSYLLFLGVAQQNYFTEFWISVKEGADRAVLEAALESSSLPGEVILDRERQAALAASDPLTGGAWNTLAFQGALALGCVAVLGFGLYAGLTVRRSKLELGVLQAIGLSRRQVFLLLATEGVMVGVLGATVGTLMGAWLSRWSLGYMSVSSGGKALTPPLLVSAEGWLLALALAEAVLAVGASVAIAVALARRLRLHEVLRVEE